MALHCRHKNWILVQFLCLVWTVCISLPLVCVRTVRFSWRARLGALSPSESRQQARPVRKGPRPQQSRCYVQAVKWPGGVQQSSVAHSMTHCQWVDNYHTAGVGRILPATTQVTETVTETRMKSAVKTKAQDQQPGLVRAEPPQEQHGGGGRQ